MFWSRGVSEERVQSLGRSLLAAMAGKRPGLFDKAWWSGQILEWAMRDQAFKTEMFRFVDVFPVLDDAEEIGRHLQEYLLRPGLSVPAPIKLALKGAGLSRFTLKVAAGQISKNLETMARGFIAGSGPDDALPLLRSLRAQGQAFTVDLLGEATVGEPEAETFAARYLDLLETLTREATGWTHDPRLDADDRGPIPRVNVSIKVSALAPLLDPLGMEAGVERVLARLLPLVRRARALGAFINLDLEQYALKDLTLSLFKRLANHPDLVDYPHLGLVIQAYLRDAESDLEALIAWARARATPITVRLVKGAYWDYETLTAQQEGWPSPVFAHKAETDASFERCADTLMAHQRWVRPAIGSHNLRSVAVAMAAAARHKVPLNGFEVQCLYGMAEPIRAACVAQGLRVRVYAPVGELLPGMAYLVRRLLENTSNQGWLRLGFAEDAAPEVLLAPPNVPEASGQRSEARTGRHPHQHLLRPVLGPLTAVAEPGPFWNEPSRDFRQAGAREAFAAALHQTPQAPHLRFAPVINGQTQGGTGDPVTVIDPADGLSVLGEGRGGGLAEVEAAVAAAQAAFPSWRDAPVEARAEVLFKLAARLRAERDALAAQLVREVGKPWRDADAEVCEAIDFCEYYGREALQLGRPRRLQAETPGELNHLSLRGRGVAAVIAPWNFPLAILAGMTTAALVMGNTVVMKPAEQAPLIAARLQRLALDAGVPPGALHLVPGAGEVVGAALVRHPAVLTVAFTGSLAVGLQIHAAAGQTLAGQRGLKRVICEMGGKNPIIVDDDADLDEAVLGVVRSAFGFAGQKCSACSRVIVLDRLHDAFVSRLLLATAALRVGPPRDPATDVGPVIDAASQARLADALERGRNEATLRLGGRTFGPGHYVAPTIFTEVDPGGFLAREELFGPILAVLRAPDFESALSLANDTDFALTAGLYSRSPSRLARAREGLRAGNVYLNRPITGAMVGRHPFGGFGLSGGGTKAGGPDYLLAFGDPRCVSENTMRRGFAPEVDL